LVIRFIEVIADAKFNNLIVARLNFLNMLVLAWLQKRGGLQGAWDRLRGQGFSSQVDDWVSTAPGDNAEVQP